MPNAQAQVQIERSTEIVRVGGKDYYMHHVKSGQTLWGISQVYQVSVEEIERLNPELKEGLKVGYVIGIPVRLNNESQAEQVESPKVIVSTPQVEKKDEPFPKSEALSEIDKDYVEIERSKEITKIGGKQYYLHYVKSGQTLYAISKAHQVTIEEIERLNPEVKDGLKVGFVIGIPVRDIQEPVAEPEIATEVKPIAEPVEEPVKEPVEESVEEPCR